MASETQKSYGYRKERAWDDFFRGDGIDIGCGADPLKPEDWDGCKSVRPYDMKDGDANTCDNIQDETYDFVYSSHCLEHMHDPEVALRNWIRITKRGGHIAFAVPHEIFYEKYNWPSRFNTDHKTSWSLEFKSNLPKSIYVPEFLVGFSDVAKVILAKTVLRDFDFTRFNEDQTRGNAVCQIDVVLQKY